MRFSTIVLCLAFTLAGPAAASEVYKWVDKDGVTHYGDKPKQGGQSLDVKPGSGSGPDPAAVQAQAARDAECQRQKAALDKYREAQAIKETDALGNVREFSAEERQKFIAMTEKKVEAACAPPAAAEAK